MRVLEPDQFKPHKGGKHKHRRRMMTVVLVLLGVVLLAGGGAYALRTQKHASAPHASGPAPAAVAAAPVVTDKSTPILFTGNQFRDLYRQVMQTYPNTEAFTNPPEITGDQSADDHIRSIAESRGFQLTRIPVTALIKLNEPLVSGETDDLLQPPAHQAWNDIKAAAKRDNIPLSLLSAYRAPKFQRDLFIQRLQARGATLSTILAGNADAAINANMGVTAVPGYSRHHTGYTVDFWCDDGSPNFGASSCFRWLKADNYLQAKKAGWIPSYPEDAEQQGPEPEPWEYVWVGKEVLFK